MFHKIPYKLFYCLNEVYINSDLLKDVKVDANFGILLDVNVLIDNFSAFNFCSKGLDL